jgi:hypothetical protein
MNRLLIHNHLLKYHNNRDSHSFESSNFAFYSLYNISADLFNTMQHTYIDQLCVLLKF